MTNGRDLVERLRGPERARAHAPAVIVAHDFDYDVDVDVAEVEFVRLSGSLTDAVNARVTDALIDDKGRMWVLRAPGATMTVGVFGDGAPSEYTVGRMTQFVHQAPRPSVVPSVKSDAFPGVVIVPPSRPVTPPAKKAPARKAAAAKPKESKS